AQRIRTIDMLEVKKVAEEMDSEFAGIINYAIIGLIRQEVGEKIEEEISDSELMKLYDSKMKAAKELMLAKNHDYGEAWRDMLVSSFTDLIMMRVLRIRQIAVNEGRTIASEGIESNLFDIINYAIFALIKISEQQ
ncbi:MAG: nucleotide modification associated domain-containing protein, partial [Chitinophagales bacterium]